MALAPELGQVPMASNPKTAEKHSSEVTMEDVMRQYDVMKLAGAKPGEKSFVWPEGNRPELVHDDYDFELPVIDLSPVLKLQGLRKEIEQLEEGDTQARSCLEAEIEAGEAAKSDVAKAIRAACEEYGFFQIINSGFPMEVVDQFTETCRQIFDLPLEEKMKLKFKPIPDKIGTSPGYVPMKRDTVFNQANPFYTWSEALELESPERHYPGRMEEIENILWPGNVESHLLRCRTEEYGKQASRVVYLLLDLIVGSLDIPEEAVGSLLGCQKKQKVNGKIRVNHYPICDHPQLTWGLQSHTDPDVITLLHQDAVGGLQIRFKDGSWHGVQPRDGAFVINCGDFLQAWTNGRFVSAEHRAVTSEKSRRMSIAYFVMCDGNYVISPRPECVDAEHPIRYRPFSIIEYVKQLKSVGLSRERGELLDKAFGI
ncbi:unnamed protein product [Calypogeia fissa]